MHCSGVSRLASMVKAGVGVEVLVQPKAHELTCYMHEIRKNCAMVSLSRQFNAIYNAVLYQPNKLCIRAV